MYFICWTPLSFAIWHCVMILWVYDVTEKNLTIITKMLDNSIAISVKDTYFKYLL